jgi:hypothetical protein
MFIKQRQVRTSRFTSKFAKASTRRREHAASIYAMAVVQVFLVLFLVIGMVQSYGLMANKFPDLPWYVRLGVPFGILLVAAVVCRALVGTVRRGIEAQRISRRPMSEREDGQPK